MKDVLETIGKIITMPQERDAIHIAIMPVVCGSPYLGAGDSIKLKPGTNIAVEAVTDGDAIGIVDPFLVKYGVQKGQTFWMFLMPGTVTSLKHNWSHPKIADEELSDDDWTWGGSCSC